jgi:stearoyl-CoA desaturase (delta-9 desaturase)
VISNLVESDLKYLPVGADMFEFLALFVLFYIWHTLGVTVGLHRLLAHRSFSCAKPLEYFLVLSGYLAFEGSPIWWATIHRAHHRHDDTELDPHSPRFGLFNAHIGWLLKRSYESHINPNIHAKDLINDPVYRFLEQGGVWHRAHILAIVLCLSFRLAILLIFGWVPALASLLAAVAVFQVPLMLNVLCHIPRLGYKSFATADDSVNIWWIAVLALGEGWHNNHHACPGSAKTGLKRHEIDPSWLFILAMKKLGLVTRVNISSASR